ncbi:MAG: type IV pilus modification PilV family protein, partial [Candidatus Humimicrobiaceae bacterium]
MKKILFKKFKEGKGFTLIETLIAVVILALVSLMMVEGVRMAISAYGITKSKTEANAIANEEIEKIRSMPYSDVGIKNGDPSGVLDAQKYTSSGYLVEYSITWTEAT